MPTILTPTELILEFFVREIWQEEEITGIQIGKETVKISLFVDDINLYHKPKNLCLKTPRHYK
jgi:hypothetical protein